MNDDDKRAALASHSQYYGHVRELPGGLAWTGLNPQICNVQIIRARFADPFGWDDSW